MVGNWYQEAGRNRDSPMTAWVNMGAAGNSSRMMAALYAILSRVGGLRDGPSLRVRTGTLGAVFCLWTGDIR